MQLSDDPGPLLEKYRPFLRMLARAQLDARLRRRIDASDLAQETLIRAYQNLTRLEDPEKMQFWLKGILKNVAMEAIRNNNAGMRSLDREEVLPSLEDSCRKLEDLLLASGSRPEDEADQKEQMLELAQALESLPARQREAIELRFVHGKRAKEVAIDMNTTPVAVAQLLFRGLRSLRKCMGCEDHGKPQGRGTS